MADTLKAPDLTLLPARLVEGVREAMGNMIANGYLQDFLNEKGKLKVKALAEDMQMCDSELEQYTIEALSRGILQIIPEFSQLN